MADDVLKMDTDAAETERASLVAWEQEFVSLIDGFQTAVNNVVMVNGVWTSDAAQAFKDTFDAWKPKEEELFNKLEEMSKKLDLEKNEWIEKTKRRGG